MEFCEDEEAKKEKFYNGGYDKVVDRMRKMHKEAEEEQKIEL